MFSSSRLVTLLSRTQLDRGDQLKAVFTDPLGKLCSTEPSTELQHRHSAEKEQHSDSSSS